MKLLVLAIVSTGCSWMATQRPLPLRPGELPSCTTSRLAPALDTYQAVGNGVLALAALADSDDGMGSDLAGVVAATSLLTGVVYAASAAHGFRNTRLCREQFAGVTRMPPAPIFLEPVLVPVDPVEAEPVEIEREIEVKIRERIRLR